MFRSLLIALSFFGCVHAQEILSPVVHSNAALRYVENAASQPPGVVWGDACETCQAEVCCCSKPHYVVGLDVLSWRPHMKSLDYAATEDGTSLSIGSGSTHRVDFDRDAGFRFELGRMTEVGWGLSVAYTMFESEGAASVNRPPGVGQLFATLSHPGGPEEADTGSATASLDFRTFDFLVRSRINETRFRAVDLFGGLRWATIDHAIDARFDGRDFVNGQIIDTMEMDAFGLTFGGEATWRMRRGWSLFGRSSVAGMFASIQNDRVEQNLNGVEQLVNFRDSFDQPVFNLDARVGLGKQIGKFELRAGYDLNIWTSVGNRIRFSDDIEEAAHSSASGDLVLDGFFGQLAVRW